jgi:carotenoid 1,2-hydratase
VSDNGASTLVLIAMLGNVFSPRYRAAGTAASPLEYSAFHVALGGAHSRFALTETDAVARTPRSLVIGASTLQWTGSELVADIDERTPWGRRVKGRVRLDVPAFLTTDVPLDAGGIHRWTPLAPNIRAEVELTSPAVRFRGHAYLDANEGDARLEDAFSRWSWSRLSSDEGSTLIAYDTVDRSGGTIARSFSADDSSIVERNPDDLEPEPLPTTLFRLSPSVRLDASGLRSSRIMQDAPFYTRSLVRGQALGRRVTGVHEWLDLDRFASPWVQKMIPYRMRNGFPRRGDPR